MTFTEVGCVCDDSFFTIRWTVSNTLQRFLKITFTFDNLREKTGPFLLQSVLCSFLAELSSAV